MHRLLLWLGVLTLLAIKFCHVGREDDPCTPMLAKTGRENGWLFFLMPDVVRILRLPHFTSLSHARHLYVFKLCVTAHTTPMPNKE